MERYLVVITLGGIVQSIKAFKSSADAQAASLDAAAEVNPEDDDVVIWDLKKNDAIFNAVRAIEEEG